MTHLSKELPDAEPRYVIYDHEYVTADERKADKLYFIMWNPSSSSTNLQMIYMHGKFMLLCLICSMFHLRCEIFVVV